MSWLSPALYVFFYLFQAVLGENGVFDTGAFLCAVVFKQPESVFSEQADGNKIYFSLASPFPSESPSRRTISFIIRNCTKRVLNVNHTVHPNLVKNSHKKSAILCRYSRLPLSLTEIDTLQVDDNNVV